MRSMRWRRAWRALYDAASLAAPVLCYIAGWGCIAVGISCVAAGSGARVLAIGWAVLLLGGLCLACAGARMDE